MWPTDCCLWPPSWHTDWDCWGRGSTLSEELSEEETSPRADRGEVFLLQGGHQVMLPPAQHHREVMVDVRIFKIVLYFWWILMYFGAPYVSSPCLFLEFAVQTTRKCVTDTECPNKNAAVAWCYRSATAAFFWGHPVEFLFVTNCGFQVWSSWTWWPRRSGCPGWRRWEPDHSWGSSKSSSKPSLHIRPANSRPRSITHSCSYFASQHCTRI